MLKFYRKKPVNTIVCTPDLVIIKYIGNNNIEIERIVFTYPHLLPSTFVVELELIHVYRTVGIRLLWKSCDVRRMSMASWNHFLLAHLKLYCLSVCSKIALLYARTYTIR